MEKSPSGNHLVDITDSEVQINCCRCLPLSTSKSKKKAKKATKQAKELEAIKE